MHWLEKVSWNGGIQCQVYSKALFTTICIPDQLKSGYLPKVWDTIKRKWCEVLSILICNIFMSTIPGSLSVYYKLIFQFVSHLLIYWHCSKFTWICKLPREIVEGPKRYWIQSISCTQVPFSVLYLLPLGFVICISSAEMQAFTVTLSP